VDVTTKACGTPRQHWWVDPGTDLAYPTSYPAYRRAREAEEKTPARHRGLGPDIDRLVWSRGPAQGARGEVRLIVRPDPPPRIQRIVAEVLRAIRRGEAVDPSIRHVARRFGLRPMRARALISGSLEIQVRPREDAIDEGWWASTAAVM
jgi:hypothetical protein